MFGFRASVRIHGVSCAEPSTRWPGELTAGKKMQVEVVNRLSALIADVRYESPALWKVPPKLSRNIGEVSPQLLGFFVLGIEVVKRDNMGFWSDENMGRSNRLNVAERDRVIRFHHLVSRNLPSHQATKQAGGIHCLFELGEYLAKCVAVGPDQGRQQLEVSLPHRHIPRTTPTPHLNRHQKAVDHV